MSWKLGEVAGIGVFVHFTFFLLIFVLGISYFAQGGMSAALHGVGLILVLFAIVVLHELGHAMAARYYGIRTKDIILLPIGGVARLERIPREPVQELVVALAGPAVNVALAILFFLLLKATGRSLLPDQNLAETGFLAALFGANIGLALFNMLPAFPMDGGRVLRALLAMQMDYVRSTRVAASIGQGMALLFGLWGLFGGGPMLMLLALFVWIGAREEASQVVLQSTLAGVSVTRAMITDFAVLSPHEPLEQAVRLTLDGFQQEFPVVERGMLVGMLARRDLVNALSQHGASYLVGDAMRREFHTAQAHDLLDVVQLRLRETGDASIPIMDQGRLVGLLTRDNLGEYVMFEAARKGQEPFANL
jgi:Zn-dependent protease/CBS domain-containing protein